MESFDIIGIAYIAIIVIFAIIGIWKGFFKGLFRLLRGIGAAFVGALLAKPVALLFYKFPFTESWQNSLSDAFLKKDEMFGYAYTSSNFEIARQKLGMPEALGKLIDQLANQFSDGSKSVAVVLSETIVFYAYMIVAFLLVFILTVILVSIIFHFLAKGLGKNGLAVALDRILGIAIYAVIGACVVCLCSYVISLLANMEWPISSWIKTTMHLGDDKWTLSKFLYNTNPAATVINWVMGWFAK